jgi:hypothetical protein
MGVLGELDSRGKPLQVEDCAEGSSSGVGAHTPGFDSGAHRILQA